jgi:DNA repair exonuclease SbcCD ATPase subunit
MNRMTDADDDGTTLPYNMRVALTEVQTLPTLEPHIQRMAELYQQRVRLEAARRSKAQQRLPRPEGSTGPMDWRRHYHNLLADEDRIGQQMESTIEAIRAQSGQILDEITRRREHIARRIDEIEARLEELQPEETDSLAGPPQDHEDRTALLGELRTLRRAERLHITLQDRVTRLREGRGNPLPMRRMVRGGLQEFLGIGSWGGRESSTGGGFDRRPGRAEGPPGPMPPQAFPFDGPGRTPRNPQFRRRINQIETEAAALKRRLKELDQERQDLIGGDSPAPAESRPSPGPGPGPNT